ncbi:MAG: tRNA (5-methylaminomethyl-2-thiouridine)(34)-methyltransferase MnmD [Bacteroides sp.]|nr:tRNA (5-methylaminomethyl-2-thiouridine)(34)-methyltransferase MnmD [Bacteroides sp.]
MELEKTADGSYTLYVPHLDEHYHSVKGALTESQHIFIDMGLKHSSAPHPRILEIGLGTGLNCFLTLLTAEENRRSVHYTGIERYPLDEATVHRLDYPALIGRGHEADYLAIHRAPWNEETELSPWFTLHKIEGDFTNYRFEGPYDIIYFDAFAPDKQPEMWEQSLFDRLYQVLDEGGILTTYCAKGSVRRMLQAAGFTVERLPGPPGGKREILRATK